MGFLRCMLGRVVVEGVRESGAVLCRECVAYVCRPYMCEEREASEQASKAEVLVLWLQRRDLFSRAFYAGLTGFLGRRWGVEERVRTFCVYADLGRDRCFASLPTHVSAPV